MWPFEEISGYFYYLVNKKQYFSITLDEPSRSEKFSAYAPKQYTVEEWADLIHKKLDQYDLQPTYPHIASMHTALFIWTKRCNDKQTIAEKPLPEGALFTSPILKESLGQFKPSKAPRQIPQ